MLVFIFEPSLRLSPVAAAEAAAQAHVYVYAPAALRVHQQLSYVLQLRLQMWLRFEPQGWVWSPPKFSEKPVYPLKFSIKPIEVSSFSRSEKYKFFAGKDNVG